jgi:hypothetical protein
MGPSLTRTEQIGNLRDGRASPRGRMRWDDHESKSSATPSTLKIRVPIIKTSLRWTLRLWHGHSTYNLPVLSAPDPRMRDTQRMRYSVTILVHPSERNPVARKGDIACHLKPSRFEVASLKPEPLSGLRGNPVGNVIFADRRGTNRGPT